jgi:hypothetical protein
MLLVTPQIWKPAYIFLFRPNSLTLLPFCQNVQRNISCIVKIGLKIVTSFAANGPIASEACIVNLR